MAVRPKNRRRGNEIYIHGFFENPYHTSTKPSTLSTRSLTKKPERYLKEPQPQRPRLERLSDIERLLDLLVEEHI